MSAMASIFYEFNLPNSTTWFYFSFLLAIALFFRFTRLLSVRNLDVVALFALVPGLLLLLEAQGKLRAAQEQLPVEVARMVAQSSSVMATPSWGPTNAVSVASTTLAAANSARQLAWIGYLWLLCGSAYWFFRCLLDLGLVSRPALAPNLNQSGLTWLGAALFVCLVVVAIRNPAGPPGPVGRPSIAVGQTQRRADYLVKQEPFSSAIPQDNSSIWVECISAVLCHLFIVTGLAFIGWRHFQDLLGGVAAATFYLLLPYTAYHVDQVHHVLPTALLIWAIAAYKRPALAGVLLGLAAGTGYAAFFLVFPWFSFYWNRGQRRFLIGFVVAALVCIVGALLMHGDLIPSIQSALARPDWQPWKQPQLEATKGFWTGVAWAPAYRLPVFVAFTAFVLTTTFWPAPKNLAHLIALSSAILIGIQFWYADQGGVYVLWYLPILLLMVFRPNCSEKTALPTGISQNGRWRQRLGRLRQSLMRALHLPEPATQPQ